MLVAEVKALGTFDPVSRPLWGIPFAVKDNIDVAGMPTTAACPDYAYTPAQDAAVVALLKAAGAVVIGKTNLDQFATGLAGVRTPHPIPRNAIDAALIPGGSSSGSAVATARGIVSFALGTDTAGSGRIPAGLNNREDFWLIVVPRRSADETEIRDHKDTVRAGCKRHPPRHTEAPFG